MCVPSQIQRLVEHFDSHREKYRAGAYYETQLRRESLAPVFAALEWDIDNRQGYAEPYEEVIHQDALKKDAPWQ